MEIWVRLLTGQQLSLNVPLTLSLLRKIFCSSWPACGSIWYSWGRWDLLCILPPLQILNALHFVYINSRLCFQQLSGSHPVCKAVLKGKFQCHFEYVIFYSWKASYLILAPVSEAQCRAPKGKPVHGQVWCAQQRLCPVFMLSPSLPAHGQHQVLWSWCPCLGKGREEAVCQFVRKRQKEGARWGPFGCSRKPMCSVAFLMLLGLPSRMLRTSCCEERGQLESPGRAQINTSLLNHTHISGYNGELSLRDTLEELPLPSWAPALQRQPVGSGYCNWVLLCICTGEFRSQSLKKVCFTMNSSSPLLSGVMLR